MQNDTLKPLFIIFSGYNQRAVIAFLRTLEEQQVEYVIVAKSSEDDIFLTKYADRVMVTRDRKALELDYIQAVLLNIKQQKSGYKYYIAPSTEALNRFLLENRKTFELNGFTVPLTSEDKYVEISDKHTFGDMCLKYNIPTPTVLADPTKEDIPFVAKPKTYYATDGNAYAPVIIEDSKSYDTFFKGSLPSNDFYFQEYINGASYYLLFYIYEDGKVVSLTQKNLVQQPNGKSVIVAQITEPLDNEIASYTNLLKSINYRGLIMIELKQGRDQSYYMIEANPRFWGPSQLFVDYGKNLFTHLLIDWGIIKTQNLDSSQGSTSYFWSGGIGKAKNGLQVLKYYDYSQDLLQQNWNVWLSNDVYNHEDTKKLLKDGK